MEGIIPAMITPFDKNGELDEKALKELVSFLKSRVHGFFVNGTFGSGPLMSIDERKKVLEIIMDEAGDDIQVCDHVGAVSTKDAIELGKHSEKMGVVGIASTIPYYYRHNESAIENYFEALIKEVKVPVYLYNNPNTTMFNVNDNLLKRLANKGLKGVKDSSFNILTFYGYIRAIKDDSFRFIVGSEAMILPTTIMKCHGCVSGIANCFPEEVVELWEEAKSGNIKKASELQEKIINIREILKGSTEADAHLGAPIIQRILREKGVNAGYPRLPLRDVTEDFYTKVKNNLIEVGIKL